MRGIAAKFGITRLTVIAIIAWIVTIAYVPLAIAAQLHSWAPLQGVLLGGAIMLGLMAHSQYRSMDYDLGYRQGRADQAEWDRKHLRRAS